MKTDKIKRLPLPARSLILKLHRWVSLGALVWILIISSTGVALVFGPQINAWSRPELFESTPGDDKGPQAAVDAALAHFEGQDTAIDNISMPVDNRGVYVLNISVTPPARPRSWPVAKRWRNEPPAPGWSSSTPAPPR